MQVVIIDTKGRALQHVTKLSKSANDDVMWVAQGNGGPWKVTFDKAANPTNPFKPGSPFDADVYEVPQGGFVKTTSGLNPITVVGETYRYNVRYATTNVITNDPDIDIEG
jgi:hypothetical protein